MDEFHSLPSILLESITLHYVSPPSLAMPKDIFDCVAAAGISQVELFPSPLTFWSLISFRLRTQIWKKSYRPLMSCIWLASRRNASLPKKNTTRSVAFTKSLLNWCAKRRNTAKWSSCIRCLVWTKSARQSTVIHVPRTSVKLRMVSSFEWLFSPFYSRNETQWNSVSVYCCLLSFLFCC